MVFLGLPLAIFLLFVVWPFVQAFYYSMTDWSGFTPDMNFVGLRNYRTLLHDDIFMTAFWNNILLAVVVPLVTVVLSFVLATMVTVGGTTHGAARGIRNSNFYRVISFFPYTIPAIIIGILWSQMFDPSAGLLNGVLTKLGFDQFASFPWLGDTRTAMPASMFVIIWGFVGLLHGAVRRSDQGDPVGLLRRDPAGRRRPDPDGVLDHDPVDPGQHPDRLHLPGHPGPRRVRLHGRRSTPAGGRTTRPS